MTSGGIFDLTRVLDLGQQQIENTQNRQAAELAAEQKRAELTIAAKERTDMIEQQAFQSAEATRTQQLGVMEGIQEEIRRAEEAINLSRSDNPLDRIKLWALQQGSASYTREGNQARINYYTNAAQALGMGEAIRQESFLDQINMVKLEMQSKLLRDDLDLGILATVERQGAELIEAYAATRGNALLHLQQQAAMEQSVLDRISDSDTLSAAAIEAQNSPTGTVNIGGVDVTHSALQNRMYALDTREHQIWQNQIVRQATILKTQNIAEIDQAIAMARQTENGTATVGGVEVTLTQLQERRNELRSMDNNAMVLDIQNQQLIAKNNTLSDERILENYSTGEIQDLIAAGGWDARHEIQYDPEMLTNIRNRKVTEMQRQQQEQVNQELFNDPLRVIAQTKEQFESIPATPGSPLQNVIREQSAMMDIAATYVTSDDEAMRAIGYDMMMQSHQQVDGAIEAEAQRLAAGNKDLASAYNFTLRGQAVPFELMSNAISGLSQKGQSLHGWLTTGRDGTLAVYNAAYGDAKASLESQQFLGGINRLSAGDIHSQAHAQAMEAVIDTATAGLTEEIYSFQVRMPTNPLKDHYTPFEFVQLVHDSDIAGAQAFFRANPDMSEEDRQKLLTGEIADPDFAAIQQAHLLIRLEQKQEGLAEAYTKWWESPDRQAMQVQFDEQMAANQTSTMQQQMQWSMVRPRIADMFLAHSMQLNAAKNIVYADQVNAEYTNFIMFQGNAANKQAYLLQQYPNLTSQEKQQAFRLVINPLLREAESQNLDPAQTSTFVEARLNEMAENHIEDTQVRRLVGKIMAGRDQALNAADSFVRANFHMVPHPEGGGVGINRQPYLPGMDVPQDMLERENQTFDWFTDMMREQQ